MNYDDVFKLVNWYQNNKRDLPWRHTKDPYKIWISEIMLQQTRVEAVKEYYNRFIMQLDSLEKLSKVSMDVLLKLWEGLGYYSRARNLKRCAEILVSKGEKTLPNNEEELKKLPGIGAYTAGAIMSIAYLKPVPAIDGNVMRVLSRIYLDDRDLLNEKVRKEYDKILRGFIKYFPPDDFTQSFIELGALICLPHGNPLCDVCPLNKTCKAHLEHKELMYPVKKQKVKRKIEEKVVLIFKYQNKYSILKRDDSGLLASLYEFPNISVSFDEFEINSYLKNNDIAYLDLKCIGDYKHIFSHIEWYMKAYLIEVDKKNDSYLFKTKDDIIKKYSLPSAFVKILENIF